jgi:hypothetical protein
VQVKDLAAKRTTDCRDGELVDTVKNMLGHRGR